jgi:hypothetical protein
MNYAKCKHFPGGIRVTTAKGWHALALLATTAALLLAPFFVAPAQNAVYDADQVKAAFLYHFGTYVQWPTPGDENEPITIAVLDEPSIAAELAAFLPGRRIEGRPVESVSIGRIDEVGDAEIVFIGRRHNANLAALIAALERRPTLVVTDAADGLEQGGMVNFQIVDERVRFEISVPRAEEAGLMLSSRLLSAALRVETSECCYREARKSFEVAAKPWDRRRG